MCVVELCSGSAHSTPAGVLLEVSYRSRCRRSPQLWNKQQMILAVFFLGLNSVGCVVECPDSHPPPEILWCSTAALD